jgi:hypothetical protein
MHSRGQQLLVHPRGSALPAGSVYTITELFIQSTSEIGLIEDFRRMVRDLQRSDADEEALMRRDFCCSFAHFRNHTR